MIPNPCCQCWDILDPPLPLLSPPVSLPSPHHGVTGTSCHRSLPAQKQQSPAHGLPAEFSIPDAGCSAPCRGAGQALPSPCPPPHAAMQVPQEVSALLLPSQEAGQVVGHSLAQAAMQIPTRSPPFSAFPGELGQVVGHPLLTWTCLQPDSPGSQASEGSTQGRAGVSKSERKANSGELFPPQARREPEIRAAHS